MIGIYDSNERYLDELEERVETMEQQIKERIAALKAELSLEYPDWYNLHDYASGHWAGRTGVLKRELAWLESLINDIR